MKRKLAIVVIAICTILFILNIFAYADEVEDLINQLLYGQTSYERETAARRLGELKDLRAVEPLIHSLKNDIIPVREAAAWALGEINSLRAIEPLIEVFRIKAPFPISLSPIAVHYLIVQPRLYLLQTAQEALVKIGKPAVESLIAALKDKNLFVRGYAAATLLDIGESVIGPLQKFIYTETENKEAVELAKDVLRRLEGKKILEELRSEDKKMVLDAIEKTKTYGLITALEDLLTLLGNIDEEIRNNARNALISLKEYIKSNKYARKIYYEVYDKSFLSLIDNALILSTTDTSKSEKLEAIEKLEDLKDVRAVDILARTLANEDMDIKLAALGCLIRMGNEIVEPLQKYLEDPEISEDVRYIISQVSYEDNQTEYALIPPQEENAPGYDVNTNNTFCVDLNLDDLL